MLLLLTFATFLQRSYCFFKKRIREMCHRQWKLKWNIKIFIFHRHCKRAKEFDFTRVVRKSKSKSSLGSTFCCCCWWCMQTKSYLSKIHENYETWDWHIHWLLFFSPKFLWRVLAACGKNSLLISLSFYLPHLCMVYVYRLTSFVWAMSVCVCAFIHFNNSLVDLCHTVCVCGIVILQTKRRFNQIISLWIIS